MGRAASVELFWIPLGAGDTTGCVRWNGVVFEAASAAWQGRRPAALYHSALAVHLDGTRHVIEMTPAWGCPLPERGVVCEGPVGLAGLGRLRWFRYEVRCWPDGTLPDEAEAVGGPQPLVSDTRRARRLVDLVPSFPTLTWGRDELGTGDMWNSNSLTAWLLARSGHEVPLGPPPAGRAPGWHAGRALAARQDARLSGAAAEDLRPSRGRRSDDSMRGRTRRRGA